MLTELTARAGVRRSLRRKDAALLAALLPAVVGAVGDRVWTTSDLYEYPGPRSIVAGIEPRVLGKTLARCAGVAVHGLRIVRDGDDARVALWKVEQAT
jgi:hypothetical protein